MPKTSYTSRLQDWERLVAALDGNEPAMPATGLQRLSLERLLAGLKAAKVRRDRLESERRQATQELRQQLAAVSDAACRLRSLVRAELGPRNQRLKSFGIAPLRGRSRR